MSRIKKALNKASEENKSEITSETVEFLRNEGFSWNKFVECWLFEDQSETYITRVYTYESGRMDIYITKKEEDGNGEFELDETVFFSSDDFEQKYEEVIEKIQSFFTNEEK